MNDPRYIQVGVKEASEAARNRAIDSRPALRPSQFSAELVAIRMHPVTLRFSDRALERDFLAHYAAAAMRSIRGGTLLGTLIYGAFGIWDAVVVPEHRALYWILRYAVVCPTFLIGCVLTFTQWFRRVYQPMLAYGVALASGGIMVMVVTGPEGLMANFGYVPLILILTFGYVMLKMRFVWAASVSLLIIAAYEVVLLTFKEMPLDSYVTSNFFLVASNIIGMVACYQLEKYARRDFLSAHLLQIEREKSERLLLNVLPESIAARLREDQVAIADRFADVSVLFADIVNFTPLTERMPPEDVVQLLNRLFSAFDQLAEHYGLEKIKTIGDAYMVAGGLPVASANHTHAVAEMALAMLATTRAVHQPSGDGLQLRIGCHCGSAVAGVIGVKKFAYDLWGDMVNTASRMESHGVPGRIQVTRSMYERLREQYDFEERGEIEVKGKGRMRVYFLLQRRG
jgi:class 3 adenylate cyclase